MAEKEPNRPVGIDLGLHTRLHTSDGQRVPARVVDRSHIRKTRCKISRSKKGSLSRRKKVAAHAKVWRTEKETSPPSRLPPRPPVAEHPQPHSHRGPERVGNAQIQEVPQEDVRTKMGDSLPDTGTQSLEGWCPVCESQPVPHLHGLLVVRSQTEHAPDGAGVRVWRVWSHQCAETPTPLRTYAYEAFPPGTTGSAATVSRCAAQYKLLL